MKNKHYDSNNTNNTNLDNEHITYGLDVKEIVNDYSNIDNNNEKNSASNNENNMIDMNMNNIINANGNDNKDINNSNNNSNPNKNKTNNNSKKIKLYNLMIAIFGLVAIVCIFILAKYFWDNYKSEKDFDKLRDLATFNTNDTQISTDDKGNLVAKEKEAAFVDVDGKLILKDFEALYKKNSDIVGWLTINGTNIDYPVMQTMNDEEYYIHRNFDKEPNDSGTLFVDTTSDLTIPSDITMIYGHNMHSGTMFAKLTNFEDEDFYNENKIITFNTIYGYGTYEVIAAFRTEIKPVEYTGFKYYNYSTILNETEFNNYIVNIKSLTPYDIKTTATYGDKLIVLSTCAYHSDNGRYVVVAKKITKVD